MGALRNPAAIGISSGAVNHDAGPSAVDQAVLTREQFGEAFDGGYPRTTRFLISRGIGLALAEESAQEAWARGWERRDQLRNPASLLSWVNSIALNVCRNHLRRREPDALPSEIAAVSQAPPTNRIDVGRALDGCTRVEREMIRSHYWAGFTSVELALDNGCTPGAVRIRLMRIRRRLRERLSA